MSRRAAACLAGVVTLLAACEGRAPEGFATVASSLPSDQRTACPDLSGTYEAKPEIVRLLRTARSDAPPAGPSLLSFVRQHDEAYIAVWHVRRDDALAALERRRRDEPGVYAAWREQLLREGWSAAADDRRYPFPVALAALDEPLAWRVGRFGRRCDADWLQALDRDGPGPGQHQAVLLARDRDGALLVKQVTYRHKTYSLWASASQRITVGVDGVRWLKTPPAIGEDLRAFSDTELPSGPGPGPRRPTTADLPSPCPDPATALDTFRQRLQALLPDGARLAAFVPGPSATPDAACTLRSVRIELVARSQDDLSVIGHRLLREQLARDYELLDRAGSDGTATATLQVTARIGPDRR